MAEHDRVRDEYMERFNQMVDRYRNDSVQAMLLDLLTVIFEGIEKDCSIECAADIRDGKPCLKYHQNEDGSLSLIVLSSPDSEEYPLITYLELRRIIRMISKQEDCRGIMIDLNDGTGLFIPKDFLLHAVNAGYQMAVEDKAE